MRANKMTMVVIQNPVKIFEKKRLWQEDNRFPA